MNLEDYHPKNHDINCAYHVDQYPWECDCGRLKTCGICRKVLTFEGSGLNRDCGGDCWECMSEVEWESSAEFYENMTLEEYRSRSEMVTDETGFEHVHALVKKAAEADNSGDAIGYAQAARDVAGALAAIHYENKVVMSEEVDPPLPEEGHDYERWPCGKVNCEYRIGARKIDIWCCGLCEMDDVELDGGEYCNRNTNGV